MQASLFNTPVF